ncbi:MAG: DNA polymerase III subunit delta [Candidatus Binatia bacterium]
MDLGAFRNQLRQKKLLRAYLFSGDQDLLKAEALKDLRIAVGGERGSVRSFVGNEAGAGEILEAQQNLSLLDPVAVVLVRQAARLAKTECDALADKLPLLSGGPALVFWDETFDKRTKLFAEIARARGEVEFAAPRRGELAGWIRGEAKRTGKHELTPRAAEQLAELVGGDLLALRSTLERLSIAVGEGRPIDEDAVERHVVSSRMHAVYELQDALSERNAAKAIGLFRRVIDEGEEIPLLVGALASAVRRLLLAREAPRGADLVQRLGVPDWKAKKIEESAKRFAVPRLKRAIDELADIDVASKTGRGEPVAALEDWLLVLCAPSGRAGASHA